jgi:C-terminal processing protease CtpA/Prc
VIVSALLWPVLAFAAQFPGGMLPGGWLGLYLDSASQAPRIVEMIPGGPAAAAGLRVGDLVVECDGQPTPTRQALVDRLASAQPGQRLRLVLERLGRRVALEVQLGEVPAEDAPVPAEPPASVRPGAPLGETKAPRTMAALQAEVERLRSEVVALRQELAALRKSLEPARKE